MRVFVILLLPLHRIWKIGRVIECAGLEIRYTPFGYRGFESLIFRKHFNKPKGMFHLAKQIRIAVRLTFYSDFCFLFASTPLLINTRKPNNSRIKQINNLQTQKSHKSINSHAHQPTYFISSSAHQHTNSYQLTNSPNHQLTNSYQPSNSQTHPTINSIIHLLINSKT